ncbi:hypothetical protein [Microbispora sp. NPDC049125]|uniref:hypothetical protein n=1 Tax=Microbispora sp. NPDC049125 TaxID=3154929 RepID=UPI0034657CE3
MAHGPYTHLSMSIDPGQRPRIDISVYASITVSTAAKAYRLLRAVLMTAVEEDKLLSRNPCRIRDADNEQTPERPILTVAQVFELADKMADRRFRALILLTTFASLRWGEVIALRRSDIDLNARTVRVREQLIELDGGDNQRGGVFRGGA